MTRHRRRRHLARAPIGLTAGVAAFAGWPRGSEAPLPPHPADAFTRAPAPTLVQPFAIGIDPMARLLLVNIDGDPDEVYLGFEPQAFDDEVHGRGLIVVAWRRDGRVDVYHQPSVTLDPATYDIAGAGLHAMLERPFDGAWFEIRETGVDADLRFHDADGRRVELTVRELGTRPRPRFGLLAPMGDAATSPSALPLVLLRDFSFVRRAASEVRVAIDGREHRIDALPVPIDRQAATFVRYAQAPLIARLNPAHDGAATLLDGAASGVRTIGETIGATRLAVVRNETHTAIERLARSAGDQAVQIAFDPPFANPLDLADGADLAGRFTITSDPTLGSVWGDYRVTRAGDAVDITMTPSGGWRPSERKWSVRLVYAVTRVFRTWPTTYVWRARLDLAAEGGPSMVSSWERVTP